jgi:cobalt-precorrin-5B (C1)-methyltransferase
MIGKMIKTAQGHMTTHVAGNQVDFAFLARVCRDRGAPEDLTVAVASANTARHFLELCQQRSFTAPLQRIADLALEQCLRFVHRHGGSMEVEVILVDFDGAVLSRAKGGEPESVTAPQEQITLIQRLAADPLHSYDDDDPIEVEDDGTE